MAEYSFGLDPDELYKSPFDSYQLSGYESPSLSSLSNGLSNLSDTVKPPEAGGFFGDLKGVFKDPTFLSGALNTAVGLGSQLWADRRVAEEKSSPNRASSRWVVS